MRTRIAEPVIFLMLMGIGGCLLGCDAEEPNPAPAQPIRTLTSDWAANSISASGDYIVSGHYKDIAVWRLSTGELVRSLILSARSDPANVISLSGDYMVSGHDRYIAVWRLSTGVLIRTLARHKANIRSVAVSGDYIVSGSTDKTIRVWSLSTGRHIRTLAGHSAEVTSVVVGGDHIVSGAWYPDNSIRVWSLSKGQLVRTLTGHTGSVGSIAVFGDYIVSGSHDETVRVWRLSTGELFWTITGHERWIRKKAVGMLVMQIRWAVEMSREFTLGGFWCGKFRGYALWLSGLARTVSANPSRVTSVFATGNYIISGSRDKTVKIWRAPW